MKRGLPLRAQALVSAGRLVSKFGFSNLWAVTPCWYCWHGFARQLGFSTINDRAAPVQILPGVHSSYMMVKSAWTPYVEPSTTFFKIVRDSEVEAIQAHNCCG
eukprot:5500378-Amphidinium_carterae.1